MDATRKTYLPAAGRDWMLPLYDPFMRLFGGDSTRTALIDQAGLRPGHRVLDIGCGTGTLVALIKRLHPQVDVVGLDPDPKALARARRKAERSGAPVRFDQGYSDDLPYPDASFDRVLSSFMFHHLEPGVKDATLREVRRVLKPGGSLHLLDFGGPSSGAHGVLAHLFHSSRRLKGNFDGGIVALMARGGLANAREVSHRATLFGPVAYSRAEAPAPAAGAGPRGDGSG